MKNLNKIGIGLGLIIVSFTLGYNYHAITETIVLPEYDCDILDIPREVREASCNIMGEIQYVPQYIEVKSECPITECDCSIDYKNGVEDGWTECVWQEKTMPETKTPKRTEVKARNFRNSKENLPPYTQK